MKKIGINLLLLCVLSLQSFAISGFYAEYTMTSKGSSQTMNGKMILYSSMDGNSRSEVKMNSPSAAGMNINMVALHKKAEPNMMYLLYESTKSFSKMDYTKYNQTATNDDAATYEIKVIGDETVNGFASKHFKIFRNGKELEDMWMSKSVVGYAGFDMSSTKFAPSSKLAIEMKAKGVEGMMVRMLVNEQGNSMQMDLVKAEKRELSDALFMVPSDYKETDIINGTLREMQMPTMDELMKMSEEERAKWIKEMESKYK